MMEKHLLLDQACTLDDDWCIIFPDVLKPEQAERLSEALSHKVYHREGYTYPYFTSQQYKMLQDQRANLIGAVEELFLKEGEITLEEKQQWARMKNEMTGLCECVAHREDYEHCKEIEPPLNDDNGHRLATILVKYILNAVEINNIDVEVVKTGSPSSVSYILKLPTGAETPFEGSMFNSYCDFALYQTYFNRTQC